MWHSVGAEHLGAEQLFVLRMLRLSTRRTALLEQQAEEAVDSALMLVPDSKNPTPEQQLLKESPGSSCPKPSDDTAKNAIVMGTVLLMPGQAAPADGSYNAYRPRGPGATRGDREPAPTAPAAAPASKAPPDLLLANKSSVGEHDAGDGGADKAAVRSSTSPAAAAKEAELTVSPHSPMRRILEMKGAMPVRRPRAGDGIPPHRRTDSDGATGSPTRLSRADAAKAAQQQRSAVRRTLASLGLPVSAEGESTPRRAEQPAEAAVAGREEEERQHEKEEGERAVGAAAAAVMVSDTLAAALSATDATLPLLGKADMTKLDVSRDPASTSLTNAARQTAPKTAEASREGIAASNVDVAAKMTTTTAAAAADIVTTPVSHDAPHSPAVTDSFGSFLQRLCPTQPAAAAPSAAASTAPSPTSARLPLSTRLAPTPAVEGSGPAQRLRESATPLTTFTASSATSPSLSSSAPPLSLHLPPPPPPPPPPYAEVPLSRASLGAGTFTTAQELLAHVRLTQPWTIVATRQWHRPGSSGGDAPSSPEAVLQQLQQRQLSMLLGRRRLGGSRGAAAAAAVAAVAKSAPILTDGEATLVSDRIDAVLPTWAYLTSHTADAAASALLSTLMPPPHDTAAGASSSATNRHRHSRNNSFASSVTSATAASGFALPEPVDVLAEERLDRQSCLFPYHLAEACALARLRRHGTGSSSNSDTSNNSSGSGGRAATTLHLLRIELLLDVQQIPTTVRMISPPERQALLERALEEFAETGVLPTTVLRGVLNDAALRLLCSVDAEVLQSIAQGGDDGATASTSAAAAAAAKVVPLSLHVHTIQGDLSATSDHSTAPASLPHPSRSLATNSFTSAAASTFSGDTDSLRPVSLASGPCTPTQLIITVLVHLSSTLPAAAEAAGTEGRDDAVPDMSASTALGVAQIVLPHLFPLSFAASRYVTRLSVSSALDYDALCTFSDGTATASAPSVAHKDGATSPAPPSPATAEDAAAAPAPWTWVDVDLLELRAACGVPEPRRVPLTSIHSGTGSPALQSVRGGAATVDSMSSSTVSLHKSRTRRSRRKAAAKEPSVEAEGEMVEEEAEAEAEAESHSEPPPPPPQQQHDADATAAPAVQEEAAVKESEAAPQEQSQPPQEVQEEETRLAEKEEEEEEEATQMAVVDVEAEVAAAETPEAVVEEEEVAAAPAAAETTQQVEEHEAGEEKGGAEAVAEEEGEEEEVDAADTVDSHLPWDTTAETAELTAVAEAVRQQLETLCGHAQLLRQFARNWASAPAEERKPKRKSKTQRAAGGSLTYAEELQARGTAMCSFAAALLACRSLSGRRIDRPAKGASPLFGEGADSLPTLASTLLRSEEEPHTLPAGDAADCPALAFSEAALAAWFERCATHLRTSICAALEQLESAILESSSCSSGSVAAMTAASVEDATASVSDGAAASAGRGVVGAQVAVRETRRQRRNAAAAARLSHALASNGADGAAAVGVPASVSPSSVLVPALALLRAAVERCQAEASSTAAAMPGPQHPRTLSLPPTAAVRTVSAAAVAQALQRRVAEVHNVLQRVQGQLAAEERRWAALLGPLEGLQAEWATAQAVLSDEAAARTALRSTCVAEAREAEQRAAEREATEAAAAAAAQSAVPASPTPEVAEAPHPHPEEKKEEVGEGEKAEDRGRDVQADHSDERAVESPLEEPQEAACPSPTSLSPPLSATRRPTRALAGPPQLATATAAAAAPSGNALNGAEELSEGGLTTNSSVAKKSDSSAATSATNSVKKARGRPSNSKAAPSRSSATVVRSPAVGSPVTAAAGSSFGTASLLAGAAALPTASPPSAVAGGGGGGGALVRVMPPGPLLEVVGQYVDVVLVRQAAPFMAVGTLLFFLFLLL